MRRLVSQRWMGAANGLAAGMMLGAAIGMTGGLIEGSDQTGIAVPVVAVLSGALLVALTEWVAASFVSSQTSAAALMVMLAFGADAFAEGLLLGASSGTQTNQMVRLTPYYVRELN